MFALTLPRKEEASSHLIAQASGLCFGTDGASRAKPGRGVAGCAGGSFTVTEGCRGCRSQAVGMTARTNRMSVDRGAAIRSLTSGAPHYPAAATPFSSAIRQSLTKHECHPRRRPTSRPLPPFRSGSSAPSPLTRSPQASSVAGASARTSRGTGNRTECPRSSESRHR